MDIGWLAVYKDGSRVAHVGVDGKEISYDALPARDEIETFALFDKANGKAIVSLHLEPGQKLIYRRRVAIKPGGPQEVCYLVGWRRTVGGECIQSIAYVFEATGRIELAGAFNEKHPWFYSPALRPCEV